MLTRVNCCTPQAIELLKDLKAAALLYQEKTPEWCQLQSAMGLFFHVHPESSVNSLHSKLCHTVSPAAHRLAVRKCRASALASPRFHCFTRDVHTNGSAHG